MFRRLIQKVNIADSLNQVLACVAGASLSAHSMLKNIVCASSFVDLFKKYLSGKSRLYITTMMYYSPANSGVYESGGWHIRNVMVYQQNG